MSTIADVAARAGVSKATASRALSGRGYVSEETRARVAEAAAELSYIAHSTATSLATGRTRTVGVIVPELDRWFFAEVLAGVQAALLESDHDLALYGMREGSQMREHVFDTVLPRRRFDGLIAVGMQPHEHELDRLLALNLPLVCLGPYAAGASSVSIDDAAASRIATEHLLDLGHRDIVFLGGSEGAAAGIGDGLRLTGYLDAMSAAGLADRTRHVPAPSTMSGGFAAAADVLGDRRSRPTAVVGVCDEAAIGTIIAARRLGVAVPAELSVVGIDDHRDAEMFALTTIRQHPRDQGAEAVRLLQRRLEHPDAAAAHVIAASSLVVRSSTAAARD